MGSDIVVYTVIVRGRDELRQPRTAPGVEFVCFTDGQAANSDGWDVQPPRRTFSDPALTVRFHKLLPHRVLPGHQTSVWLDGSLELTGDVRELVDAGGELGLFRHRHRQCAYEEAEVVVETRRAVPQRVREQMRRYRAAGFPDRYGLWEGGAIVRRDSAQSRRLGEAWWDEITRHTTRDQLSLAYVLWSQGVKARSLPGNVAENPWLRLHPHPYLPHPSFFGDVFGEDRAAWPDYVRHAAGLEKARG